MKLRISGVLVVAVFIAVCDKQPKASCRTGVTRYGRGLWRAIAACAMMLAFGLFQTVHALTTIPMVNSI
jgi:hypothetical protein